MGILRHLGWGMVLIIGFTGGASAQTPPHSAAQVQEKLKEAVQDSQRKLGHLDAEQLRIFEEEAIAHYSRFIRDYRASGQSVVADVDLEALKRFVSFYGAKVFPDTQQRKIGIWIQSAAGCERCKASVDPLRRLLTERFQRRGFIPQWLTSQDISGPAVKDFSALQTRVHETAFRKGMVGALAVAINPAVSDTIDDAHADEQRYQVSLAISFPGHDAMRHRGSLELLANDNLELAVSKILTSSLSEMVSEAVMVDSDEVIVEINGVGDFDHYSKVKAAVEERLKPMGVLEERRIARGVVAFALFSKKPQSEIEKLFGSFQTDAGRLVIESSEAQFLKVVIQ